MMSLSQMVDVIGTKVGKNDAVSQTACKKFLRQRHDMICLYTIWRELLRLKSVAVTTANQYIIFPQTMALVLAIRYDTRFILPVQKEYLYLTYANIFEQSGEPWDYSLERPVATEVKPAGEKLKFVQVQAADNGKKVRVEGEYEGVIYRETVTLSSGADVLSTNTYDDVWQMGKDDMTGDLVVKGNTSGTTLITVWAEHRDVKCQQIQLHPIPSTDKTMLVLYKIRARQLIDDNDTPELSFMENTLIAFGTADMLERSRQYAKAQAKIEEANTQLAILKDAHEYQRANQVRLVPDAPFIASDDVDFACDGGYDQFLKA
ncbi:MAG TPA: hypothetical protein VGN17_05185 [Bryobacteraceae bacterium]|jgi:hypothetical protein